MSITAQFEFDEIEYRQALHEMLGPLRWTLPVGAIVLSVMALWLGVFRHWAEVSLGDAILTGLPWVLLGAFFLSLTPLLSRAKARKALELDPSLNGTQRHTVGDPIEPAGQRCAPTNRGSPPCEDQESGLESVFGVVRIT